MRSVKFLLAAVILLSLSREATAQYVQPMRYDHYSVTQQMNVGAGVVRTTNASAYLEIGPTSGGNKGLLIPRLSTTERDAISTPATGLLIFNTTTGTFNFYTGSAWSAITSGSSTGISQLGNSGNWGLTRVNDSTYRVDSMAVMTKYQSEKTRDSLLALIGAKLNISDTANKWLSSIYRKTGTDSVFKVIGGTHIFAFKDSVGTGGGGSGYPAVPNPDNPNNWTVIPDKRNPIFSVENMGGVVALESSMYAPSPISINDTLFRVYAKGDATNSIHYWESTDSMRTWQYIDTAIYPTPSPTWDSVDIAFPHAAYDPVGDTIHIYYTGGKGTGGPDYGIGHIAIKSNAAHPLTRPSAPFISNSQAATLLGESVGFIDLSGMVKKDGEHYWFGSYSHGDSVFLWAGKGPDWRNCDSMWRIMSPNTSLGYNGIINPTVYKRGDLYYGIFADSRVDADGVRDTSKSMLASMYSPDLITWTRLPNFFMQPRGDTSWDGKQVYDMQFLKVNGGNYDELYRLRGDTIWGGPLKDQTEGFYYGFVSGSYFGCCLDQSGIIYVLAQEDDKMSFGISKRPVRNDISFYQRNNTLALNIPDATSQVRGALTPEDWQTFNAKADSSGGYSYIWNNATVTPQNASFHVNGAGIVLGKMSVGSASNTYSLNVDAYQNSGLSFTFKNSSNFGISMTGTVTDQITNTWTGTGIGYLAQATSNTYGFYERAYKRTFQPVYYPFADALVINGQAADNDAVVINSMRTPGNGLAHTANGTALTVNQTDGFNTTSGLLTSYGIVGSNTATRESGSNALTNYAGRFVSSGGQNNYSLSLGNPAQYEANYGSLFSARSLTDKNYVDSIIGTVGGGGSFVDTIYRKPGQDSIFFTINGGAERAIRDSLGSGSGGWALTGNSITAGTNFIGTTNNTSLRFYTNNTLRAQIDSLGNIVQSSGNTIHSNVKFHQRYSGSASDYYWFADDPFNSLLHYMRGDGAAYHTGSLAIGASKFTVDANGNITKINNVATSFPGSQGAANTVWRNDGSGNLSSYVVTAGTQTPTATNGTNVSASTPGQEQYSRVGNVVTVSGFIEITCTSAGSSSDIDLSLPVASAFTTTTQLSGVILESVTGVASPGHGTVTSNSTNDRVTILFTPRATGSLSYRYTYTYQIL